MPAARSVKTGARTSRGSVTPTKNPPGGNTASPSALLSPTSPGGATSSADDDAVLPLQEWLKLLTSHGVPMRTGMALAAKAYTSHNTRAKLRNLDAEKYVSDRETRKSIVNALKGLSSGQKAKRKWARDNDLLAPLEPVTPTLPTSFDFNEILDPEQLIPVTVTCNRAPVKTAWAYTVARRLGFDVQESLSLAHVYVHIGSMKHALALGNIYDTHQTRDAEEEIRELPGEQDYRRPGAPPSPTDWRKRRNAEPQPKAVGSSQPWVMLLRTKPVIERADGTWRAIQKGVPVEPSQAYLYITRALKTFAPHVMGAMQLVANSYAPDELNILGAGLYSEFKPDVVEWGQRGTVSVAAILDQIKEGGSVAEPVDKPVQVPGDGGEGTGEASGEGETASAVATEAKDDHPERETAGKRAIEAAEDAATPAKKHRAASVDEYEAILDDVDDSAFLAAADLYNI